MPLDSGELSPQRMETGLWHANAIPSQVINVIPAVASASAPTTRRAFLCNSRLGQASDQNLAVGDRSGIDGGSRVACFVATRAENSKPENNFASRPIPKLSES